MAYWITDLRSEPPYRICFVPGTLARTLCVATKLWNALQDHDTQEEDFDAHKAMWIDFNYDGAHGLRIWEAAPKKGDEPQLGRLVAKLSYTTHER